MRETRKSLKLTRLYSETSQTMTEPKKAKKKWSNNSTNLKTLRRLQSRRTILTTLCPREFART